MMTPPDHHPVASALLRREGRHDYRVSVVVIPGEGLALLRQWGPRGSLCAPSLAAGPHASATDAVADIEAILGRLHERGYVAEDDVAPLLEVAALDAALRLSATSDARALRALMWPDAHTGPGTSLADALFG